MNAPIAITVAGQPVAIEPNRVDLGLAHLVSAKDRERRLCLRRLVVERNLVDIAITETGSISYFVEPEEAAELLTYKRERS